MGWGGGGGGWWWGELGGEVGVEGGYGATAVGSSPAIGWRVVVVWSGGGGSWGEGSWGVEGGVGG